MSLGFLVKKIVSYFLMPLPIGIIFFVMGLWLLFRAHLRGAKILFSLALLWIGLVTYAPVVDGMLNILEYQYPKLTTIPKQAEYILLLGGDREQRAWEVLRLHQALPHATIITSGYSSNEPLSDARQSANLLINSGIDPHQILLQEQVKDTQEEAEALKTLIGNAPFILVTSAYHMPRAMMIFHQAGLNPIPAPTDFYPRKSDRYQAIFQAKQLEKSERALHEFLGMLWLWVK